MKAHTGSYTSWILSDSYIVVKYDPIGLMCKIAIQGRLEIRWGHHASKKCKLHSQTYLQAQLPNCEDILVMGAVLQLRHKIIINSKGNKHQRDGKIQYRDSEICHRSRSL